jgi:hypothetical protein
MTMHDTSDEQLAFEFLAGRFEETQIGQVSFEYLAGDKEQEARAALVRVLRGDQPLSHNVRFRLAALFDTAHSLEEREFRISFRSKGRPNNAIALEIALYIAAEIALSANLRRAMGSAADRYNVSSATVWRAWSDHKGSELVRQMIGNKPDIN